MLPENGSRASDGEAKKQTQDRQTAQWRGVWLRASAPLLRCASFLLPSAPRFRSKPSSKKRGKSHQNPNPKHPNPQIPLKTLTGSPLPAAAAAMAGSSGGATSSSSRNSVERFYLPPHSRRQQQQQQQRLRSPRPFTVPVAVPAVGGRQAPRRHRRWWLRRRWARVC